MSSNIIFVLIYATFSPVKIRRKSRIFICRWATKRFNSHNYQSSDRSISGQIHYDKCELKARFLGIGVCQSICELLFFIRLKPFFSSLNTNYPKESLKSCYRQKKGHFHLFSFDDDSLVSVFSFSFAG